MPITRSMSSRRQGNTRVEPIPKERIPVTESQAPSAIADAPETKPSTSMERGTLLTRDKANTTSLRSGSRASKKALQRSEALEKIAKARLEEARAATALAEAEAARIEAQSTDADDDDSVAGTNKDKSILIKSWLNTQANVDAPIDLDIFPSHQKAHTEMAPGQPIDRCAPLKSEPQKIDVAALAAALNEVARATTSHALPKYLQELPSFSGASSEWLAFKAAYRDTNCHFTKTDNLTRLRRCLRGVAREAAISLFIAETDPDEVMRLLELRFGRPDALVMAEMDRIRTLPRLTDNPRDICIFASRVNNIVAVVQALHKVYYLYNPEAVRAVVDKMTPAIKYRWYDYASGRPEDEPDLIKISCFLAKQAELCSRYAPAENVGDHSATQQKKHLQAYVTFPSETPMTRLTSRKPAVPINRCPMCETAHKIRDCQHFKDLDVSDRWKRAKEMNACFRCLNKRSFRHRCSYKPCGVDGCKGSHHPLLHSPKTPPTEKDSGPDVAVVTSARPEIAARAFLKILPVTIAGPVGTFDTYALLDEGSTVTLIEENVAQIVGATGPTEPFDIEGVAGARVSAESSRRVSLKIMGRHRQKFHDFTARTINNLHLSPQTIDKAHLEDLDYLEEVSRDLVYHRGTPTLLIGQDNWHLIVSRSIKSGKRGQLAASLTELGWVLHGSTGEKAQRAYIVSKITVHNNEEKEERIDELVKKFSNLDRIGIEQKCPKNDPNKRALTILDDRSVRFPDGRFKTGLLWRNDKIVLPNNKDMTISCLQNVERKDRNPDLQRQYYYQMKYLLNGKYAEITFPLHRRTGPHLALLNPSRIKCRIVLDAAGKAHGVCLNNLLLTGPDLLESLPGILMRLRRVGVMVDGEALRYLWRRDRQEGPLLAFNLVPEQRPLPVLDRRHSYTRLDIAWVYKLNNRVGTETVVNEVRSHLWVLRLRPTVRSIVRSCIKCRILRAKPSSPMTGDHPSSRLAHHQRPFSYVGVDYFGPCNITSGRRHEKRYVALFTCLTTRAVHIELAGSLTTDSAIMVLRRMIARRGCPIEIHSDNGTNLRGADAELRKAAYQATKEEASSRFITWRFIPPGAPFMGGAWERLVQSIKRALAATLNERYPTEEVLLTLLLEAEYTVNNRPLTPVSVSPDDPESLTPLHFILGGPSRVPSPGNFSDADLNAKQRWRHSQRLADIFWNRFVREYMPLLQNRRESRNKGRAPQIGDVVLLVDENLPRNTCPRGQVVNTFPGKMGSFELSRSKRKRDYCEELSRRLSCSQMRCKKCTAGECARPIYELSVV